jgi:Plasmid pRiA4b ORF-3-like protein
MSTDAIARLKITLDDVKPVVLRRIEVPLTLRLDRLHLAIQAAMGWTNSHLYEILACGVGWGMIDPDDLYDFGDGWEHTIKVERLIDPEPGVLYPRLIEAAGRCPPEDVGGPWGYADLLDAIHDPKHERHGELKEWIADDFDPNAADAQWLSREVAALAKLWSRKPPVKRTRRT